ncbi:MAG TPA: DNA-directed RNA polymerase subunit alpha C-terminal domain-containing protein [Candidatus Bathyarchaeia archaeon]|nr:DNA-directed RNA polymerase subunit alpha C-terminal domain-containing protein [Candidatus Bathyarchaeia archaeon]
MDQKIISACKKLVLAVTGRPDDEDFLPIRKADVEAIMGAVDSLNSLDVASIHSLADIVMMNFGLDGKGVRTQKEIGQLMGGVSRSRIGQAKKRALRWLRHHHFYRHLNFDRLFRTGLEQEADSLSRKYWNLRQESAREVASIREEMLRERRMFRLGSKSVHNINISKLELSVRAHRCLTSIGIDTLGKLIQKTEADLLGITNFGIYSLNEVKEILCEYGLSLAKGKK